MQDRDGDVIMDNAWQCRRAWLLREGRMGGRGGVVRCCCVRSRVKGMYGMGIVRKVGEIGWFLDLIFFLMILMSFMTFIIRFDVVFLLECDLE